MRADDVFVGRLLACSVLLLAGVGCGRDKPAVQPSAEAPTQGARPKVAEAAVKPSAKAQEAASDEGAGKAVAAAGAQPSDPSDSPPPSGPLSWTDTGGKYVQVSRNAQMFTSPAQDAEHFYLSVGEQWAGQRKYTGRPVTFRYIGERGGGQWLEVQSEHFDAGVSSCTFTPWSLAHFKLTVFVKREAVFEVLTAAVTLKDTAGLKSVILPGRVVKKRDGKWYMPGVRKPFRGEVADAAVGRVFSGAHFAEVAASTHSICRDGLLHPRGSSHRSCKLTSTRITAWRQSGDDAVVVLERECSRLQKRVKMAKEEAPGRLAKILVLKSDGRSARLGAEKNPVRQQISAGTTAYWRDGRIAGQVTKAHVFKTSPRRRDHRQCYTSKRDCKPALFGGPKPDCGDDDNNPLLTLCFDP